MKVPTLVAQQLARDRATLLGWSLGLFAYFLAIGATYATVKDVPTLDDIWHALPESIKEAFGGARDITSPGGYIESQGTSLLPLVLGGLMAAYMTRRLAGAEASGELDLALSLPVRRVQYLLAQWLAGIVLATACVAAAAAGITLGMRSAGVGTPDLVRLAYMAFETLPFILATQAIALLVAVSLHRRGPAAGILSALLGLWYLLHVVSHASHELADLRWGSLYSVWSEGDAYALATSRAYLAACALLTAGCLLVGARVWDRKDLLA